MALFDYLKFMLKHDASDLYLTNGAPPSIKVNGTLQPISKQALKPGEAKQILYKVLNEEQIKEFEKEFELNFAIDRPEIGRFRVNMFFQRHEVGAVIRSIKTQIPTPEDLKLPDVLKSLFMEKRGLILIVGATGSGKSTTLASMMDYRNRNSKGHIITIEDPIEYVHTNIESIFNQREVGVDTKSYREALKNTLRQAPDVILIGEIRAQETMEHAITFAETGHLCLSTLHANNANQALERIISFFPKDNLAQLLLDLSLNLKAIVSQRLVKTTNGQRIAAIEILINTPLVADHIKRGEVDLLKDLMDKSYNLGMQTFDSCLYRLYSDGVIEYDEAIRNADSKNNLRLRIQLDEKDDSVNPNMKLVDEDKPSFQRNIATPTSSGGGKKPSTDSGLTLKDD